MRSMNLKTGQIVGGRCQILRILGAGNFGETYLAKDLHAMGERCAVKRFSFTSSSPTTLNKAKDLFEREAAVLKNLTNPPRNSYISRFIAYFNDNQEFYLVQEFIEGHTLREELHQKSKFQEDEVVHLLEDVLEGLKFLHSERFIHRDIKPDNLMRRASDNSIVLIDFGAVKQKVTQLASSGTIIYSPGYAPPEQRRGFTSENSDIYALGMTAIEALTGWEPEKLKDPNTGKIVWPSQLEVSERLVKILEKMVADDFRKGRYQSAEAALQDVRELRNTKIVPHSQAIKQRPSIPIGLALAISVFIGLSIVFVVAFAVVRFLVAPQPKVFPSPAPTESLTPEPILTSPSPTPKESPTPEPTTTSSPSLKINCGPFRQEQEGEVCPEDQDNSSPSSSRN